MPESPYGLRALRTGAAGFIGSNLIRFLLDENTDKRVVALDARRRQLVLRNPSWSPEQAQIWLERAIDSELGLKGLIKARPADADLLVGYSAGSPLSSGVVPGRGKPPGAGLVLDLFDRRTGQAVYRAAAKATAR